MAVLIRPARRRLAAVLLAAGLAFAAARPAAAETAPSREYQIKAAFLYNFARFVEWPPAAFAGPDAPLQLGILGEDPFGPALDDLARSETVQHRRLVVRRSRRAEDLRGCQLVFVSRSELAADILPGLGGSPILTVGDAEGFARQGGMIDFYLDANRVRFEINSEAARRGGLRISSQLLSLGRLVEGSGR